MISEAPELIEALRMALSLVGHQVRIEEDAQRLNAELSSDPPDVLVADLRNPGLAVDDLLAAAEAGRLTVPLVVVPCRDATDEARIALRRGAADYLRLPLVPEEMLFRVIGAARTARGRRGA